MAKRSRAFSVHLRHLLLRGRLLLELSRYRKVFPIVGRFLRATGGFTKQAFRVRGKAGLACGLGRVRFWKPTGLPFIAEPIRFANPDVLGYAQHPNCCAAEVMTKRSERGAAALYPEGAFGLILEGEVFRWKSSLILRFVSPVVRRFLRATGGFTK